MRETWVLCVVHGEFQLGGQREQGTGGKEGDAGAGTGVDEEEGEENDGGWGEKQESGGENQRRGRERGPQQHTSHPYSSSTTGKRRI